MGKVTIKWDDLQMTLSHGGRGVSAYFDTETQDMIIPDVYYVELFEGANVDPDEENAVEKVLQELEDMAGVAGTDDDRKALEQIVMIETDESERYVRLWKDDSHTGYRDMEAYIESLDDEQLAEKLWIAIDGRGAFRRFKDVLLRHPDARDAWFAFETARKQERVSDQLKQHGIEAEFV